MNETHSNRQNAVHLCKQWDVKFQFNAKLYNLNAEKIKSAQSLFFSFFSLNICVYNRFSLFHSLDIPYQFHFFSSLIRAIPYYHLFTLPHIILHWSDRYKHKQIEIDSMGFLIFSSESGKNVLTIKIIFKIQRFHSQNHICLRVKEKNVS